MEEIKQESQTPQIAPEQTVQSNEKSAEQILAEKEAELASLAKKNVELQAQKEHWREKYDRDIALKTTTPEHSEVQVNDVFSDEGKFLKKEITALKEELHSIKKIEARREVESLYPVLRDRKEAFEAFLEDDDNKKLSIKKAAKLFLVENNLLSPMETPRKGLEKPTAGGQVKPEPGYTADEIRHMMKNDYKKYEALLRAGKI